MSVVVHSLVARRAEACGDAVRAVAASANVARGIVASTIAVRDPLVRRTRQHGAPA